MSKADKLLEKLKNNPNNVRFEVIQKLLLGEGFIEKQPAGGSSHYTYIKGSKRITVPRHQPVNKVYVKKVLKMLED